MLSHIPMTFSRTVDDVDETRAQVIIQGKLKGDQREKTMVMLVRCLMPVSTFLIFICQVYENPDLGTNKVCVLTHTHTPPGFLFNSDDVTELTASKKNTLKNLQLNKTIKLHFLSFIFLVSYFLLSFTLVF